MGTIGFARKGKQCLQTGVHTSVVPAPEGPETNGDCLAASGFGG